MNCQYNLNFDLLCADLGLGKPEAQPEQLFGGHLHRMYALVAATGKYAVKALNPQVMRRPEARANILHAESAARIAAGHIPAAPAKMINGNIIHEVGGQHYLVFDWIDGRTLYFGELTTGHCAAMGGILADLHHIDFSALDLDDKDYVSEIRVDWDSYLHGGTAANAPWLDTYRRNLDNLHRWNERLISAAKRLAPGTVISHGDLEPKNVLWRGDVPVIIDWEAAGCIHPMHDLAETALYWSADETGKPHKALFTAFVTGYKSKTGTIAADWPTVLDKGFGSKLGWLEYSLKRALGIESADEAERLMGTEHVINTLRMLEDYSGMRDDIIAWLETV